MSTMILRVKSVLLTPVPLPFASTAGHAIEHGVWVTKWTERRPLPPPLPPEA